MSTIMVLIFWIQPLGSSWKEWEAGHEIDAVQMEKLYFSLYNDEVDMYISALSISFNIKLQANNVQCGIISSFEIKCTVD